MMKEISALSDSRSECSRKAFLRVLPPKVHTVAVATGGLKRLFSNVKEGKYCLNHEIDCTDSLGRFQPPEGAILAGRYRVVDIICCRGQSAVLLRAQDIFRGDLTVVIKALHDQDSYFDIGFQEAHTLRRLACADPHGASHTVRLLNTFLYGRHFCLVFEALDPKPVTHVLAGLHLAHEQLLRALRKVSLQLLQVVGFLRQNNTIHADLKPENILLHSARDLNSLRVIDFGNAINHVHREMSLYYNEFEVQTLLYRAPEVLYGIPFGAEIDMWSLGCILAEIYLGQPLIHGSSKRAIIQSMVDVLGPLPHPVYCRGKFFDQLEGFTQKVATRENVTVRLLKRFQQPDYTFSSFLAGLLEYDPDRRLTPVQAALHPFLAPEMCLSYLLPASGTKEGAASTIFIQSEEYNLSPQISSDIRRQHPSSLDLLRMGTRVVSSESAKATQESSPTFSQSSNIVRILTGTSTVVSAEVTQNTSPKLSDDRPITSKHLVSIAIGNTRESGEATPKHNPSLSAPKAGQSRVSCGKQSSDHTTHYKSPDTTVPSDFGVKVNPLVHATTSSVNPAPGCMYIEVALEPTSFPESPFPPVGTRPLSSLGQSQDADPLPISDESDILVQPATQSSKIEKINVSDSDRSISLEHTKTDNDTSQRSLAASQLQQQRRASIDARRNDGDDIESDEIVVDGEETCHEPPANKALTRLCLSSSTQGLHALSSDPELHVLQDVADPHSQTQPQNSTTERHKKHKQNPHEFVVLFCPNLKGLEGSGEEESQTQENTVCDLRSTLKASVEGCPYSRQINQDVVHSRQNLMSASESTPEPNPAFLDSSHFPSCRLNETLTIADSARTETVPRDGEGTPSALRANETFTVVEIESVWSGTTEEDTGPNVRGIASGVIKQAPSGASRRINFSPRENAELNLSEEDTKIHLPEEDTEVHFLEVETQVHLSEEGTEVPLQEEDTEVSLQEEDTKLSLQEEDTEVDLREVGTEEHLHEEETEVDLSPEVVDGEFRAVGLCSSSQIDNDSYHRSACSSSHQNDSLISLHVQLPKLYAVCIRGLSKRSEAVVEQAVYDSSSDADGDTSFLRTSSHNRTLDLSKIGTLSEHVKRSREIVVRNCSSAVKNFTTAAVSEIASTSHETVENNGSYIPSNSASVEMKSVEHATKLRNTLVCTQPQAVLGSTDISALDSGNTDRNRILCDVDILPSLVSDMPSDSTRTEQSSSQSHRDIVVKDGAGFAKPCTSTGGERTVLNPPVHAVTISVNSTGSCMHKGFSVHKPHKPQSAQLSSSLDEVSFDSDDSQHSNSSNLRGLISELAKGTPCPSRRSSNEEKCSTFASTGNTVQVKSAELPTESWQSSKDGNSSTFGWTENFTQVLVKPHRALVIRDKFSAKSQTYGCTKMSRKTNCGDTSSDSDTSHYAKPLNTRSHRLAAKSSRKTSPRKAKSKASDAFANHERYKVVKHLQYLSSSAVQSPASNCSPCQTRASVSGRTSTLSSSSASKSPPSSKKTVGSEASSKPKSCRKSRQNKLPQKNNIRKRMEKEIVNPDSHGARKRLHFLQQDLPRERSLRKRTRRNTSAPESYSMGINIAGYQNYAGYSVVKTEPGTSPVREDEVCSKDKHQVNSSEHYSSPLKKQKKFMSDDSPCEPSHFHQLQAHTLTPEPANLFVHAASGTVNITTTAGTVNRTVNSTSGCTGKQREFVATETKRPGKSQDSGRHLVVRKIHLKRSRRGRKKKVATGHMDDLQARLHLDHHSDLSKVDGYNNESRISQEDSSDDDVIMLL